MNNIESCSNSLAVSVGLGYMCTLTNWRQILLLPEKFGAAASRILIGTPARQPHLDRNSRKSESSTAEGSTQPGNEEQKIK